MKDAYLWPYECPTRHTAISDIIRRTSSNQTDVREVALTGLDLSSTKAVLDLGCGFGFMTEAVAPRICHDGHVVGVDACPANSEPFVQRIAAAGRSARFVCELIDARLDWPDKSFDLIVASYALYFFPKVVPEIARLLAPNGVFLALTHTEESCRDLLRIAGLRGPNSRLLTLVRAFSAENARALLAPWFGEIERFDYQNALTFELAQRDDLVRYMEFKLPLLAPDSQPGSDLAAPLARAVRTSLARCGRVVLDKDDAAFRCRRPKCR